MELFLTKYMGQQNETGALLTDIVVKCSESENGHVVRVVSRRNSQSVTELRPRDFAYDLFPDRARRTQTRLSIS